MNCSAAYRSVPTATSIAWNCKRCGSGDRPNLYCCRLARRWRGVFATRTSPPSGRARDTAALSSSPTVPADKGEGGAAWRYAAIALNKPRIAVGSGPRADTTAFQLSPSFATRATCSRTGSSGRVGEHAVGNEPVTRTPPAARLSRTMRDIGGKSSLLAPIHRILLSALPMENRHVLLLQRSLAFLLTKFRTCAILRCFTSMGCWRRVWMIEDRAPARRRGLGAHGMMF